MPLSARLDEDRSSSSGSVDGTTNGLTWREPEWTSRRKGIPPIVLLLTIAAVFVVTAVLGVVSNLRSTFDTEPVHQSAIPEPRFHCGTTTAEAEALGCTYNELELAWLPQACQDYEITELFHQAGPWTYWSDSNKTRELTLEEVSRTVDADEHVWMTQRWHSVHCLFQWKKMHRAVMLNSGRMAKSLADYHHTMHCESVIMDEITGKDPEGVTADGNVEFVSC